MADEYHWFACNASCFSLEASFSRKSLWKHWKLILKFAERIVSLNVQYWYSYRLVPMPQWLRYRKCLLLHARPAGRTQYDDHYNLMQFFKCEYWFFCHFLQSILWCKAHRNYFLPGEFQRRIEPLRHRTAGSDQVRDWKQLCSKNAHHRTLSDTGLCLDRRV